MKKVLTALTLVGAFASLPPAHALSYSYEVGVVHQTDAFASFGTTGAEMAGMGVHVEYVDGSTYDAAWESFGIGSGGVNNSNVRIEAGHTGLSGPDSYKWLLFNPSSLGIRSVSLDGQPGNTVFDNSGPFGAFVGINFVGTAGTAGGSDFNLDVIYRTLWDGISITYSDAVGLGDAAPVGDVFRRMKIEFATALPLFPRAGIWFRQDTDSLAFGSVLAPVAPTAPVAVPDGGATLAMLGVGLAGLVACARRRPLATS